MNKKLVSIIIACYNSELWIEEAIQSCLAQTYQPLEVIVVNDGSTDQSLKIIKRYSDEIRIVNQANKGLSAARNAGIVVAKGDYCLFLDADDFLAASTITVLVEAIGNRTDTIAICNYVRFVDEGNDRKITETGEEHVIEGDILYQYLTKWTMPIHSMFWPRLMVQDLNGFDETLQTNHDIDIVTRAILKGVSMVRVYDGCAFYRTHLTVSSSSTQLSKEKMLSRMRFAQKLERLFEEYGMLEQYALVAGKWYSGIVAQTLPLYPDIAQECLNSAMDLGGRQAISGSFWHNIGVRILGFKRKERLAYRLAQIGIGRKIRKSLVKSQDSYKR